MRTAPDLLQKYYSEYDEWGRLERDAYHRLEFETTLHFLTKHLPRRGLVLDAGGGPGRYTIELARRGYQVALVDLTPKLLDIARREVGRARVQRRVLSIEEGSIDDLSRFADRSFDAVLCLGGPLNHLRDRARRERAIGELVRVAKPRAPLFLSVIGLLATLRSGLVQQPGELEEHPGVYRRILRSGDYDGRRGFAPCHFYRLSELESSLRRRSVSIVEEVGLSGLATGHMKEVGDCANRFPRAWRAWREIHLATCTDPGVVACNDHILIVARRSSR